MRGGVADLHSILHRNVPGLLPPFERCPLAEPRPSGSGAARAGRGDHLLTLVARTDPATRGSDRADVEE